MKNTIVLSILAVIILAPAEAEEPKDAATPTTLKLIALAGRCDGCSTRVTHDGITTLLRLKETDPEAVSRALQFRSKRFERGSATVRASAAYLCGDLQDEASLPMLIEGLRDEYFNTAKQEPPEVYPVRNASYTALCRMGYGVKRIRHLNEYVCTGSKWKDFPVEYIGVTFGNFPSTIPEHYPGKGPRNSTTHDFSVLTWPGRERTEITYTKKERKTGRSVVVDYQKMQDRSARLIESLKHAKATERKVTLPSPPNHYFAINNVVGGYLMVEHDKPTVFIPVFNSVLQSKVNGRPWSGYELDSKFVAAWEEFIEFVDSNIKKNETAILKMQQERSSNQ